MLLANNNGPRSQNIIPKQMKTKITIHLKRMTKYSMHKPGMKTYTM